MRASGVGATKVAGVFFTVIALATCATSGAAVVPGTRPATAPTSAPVDPSTPKGALKTLTRALEAGDRKTLLEMFAAESPAEQKIAEATAALAEATAELRRASVKAFGEQASRPLGVDGHGVDEAFARVDASTETIDGDKATVSSPEQQGDSLQLVRKDAKWRVPMSQIAGPAKGAELDQQLRDSAEQAKLLKELAGDVTAGKFKSAVEARQELDRRIMKLAMPSTAPSTAPAATTAPAKR
jgi:hypothetical protein